MIRGVGAQAFESVSTWWQPIPVPISNVRTQLIHDLAGRLVAIRPTRIRAVVDGYSASGKTAFGHELAQAVRALGRSTLRASFDDFKKPWRDAREKGYDRVSGEGFYRNAPDFESARELLLRPAGPDGSGIVALCGHDPLTGEDVAEVIAFVVTRPSHVDVDYVSVMPTAQATARDVHRDRPSSASA